MKLVTYYTESHSSLLTNYFLPSLKDNFEIIKKCGQQISPDGNYFNQGFSETTKDKINFLLQTLQTTEENEIVLFCDVDIIFLGSIENYLNKYTGYDMVFQEGHGGLNTGFFIMKNNEKVRSLLDSVVKNCHMYHDDQITLNFLIKNTELKYNTFDTKIMSVADSLGPKIWVDEAFDIPEETLVFHACWCAGVENKIKLLNYVLNYKKS